MRAVALLAAAACTLPALAQDYPKLKPGQWEITMRTAAGAESPPPRKSTMCTDEAMQQEMMKMGTGAAREMCSKNDMKRDGNRILATAECRFGESKVTSRSVMTFTGDTAYRTEITAVYDPRKTAPRNRASRSTASTSARAATAWCPATSSAPTARS